MSISGVTPVSTVGAKNVPASYFSPVSRSPPRARLAPLPTASDTCRSIFSIAPSSISGPIVMPSSRPLPGLSRLGVGKNDERGVPAELERHPLDVPGRSPGELLADLGRAGEGELAHGRVGQE